MTPEEEKKLASILDRILTQFITLTFSFIVIKGDRIDATPGFYTYDASKIRVGEIPPGLVGMPVEFQGEYILTF